MADGKIEEKPPEVPVNTTAAAVKLSGFLTAKTKVDKVHSDTLTGLKESELLGKGSHIFIKTQGLDILRSAYRTYFDELRADEFKAQGIVGLIFGATVFLLPEETEFPNIFSIYKRG